MSDVRWVSVVVIDMAVQRSDSPMQEKHPPPVPPAVLQRPVEDLPALGEALKARAGDVLSRTVALTAGPGYQRVDSVIQESFERIGASSTMAVSGWMAGRASRSLSRLAGRRGRSSPSWSLLAPFRLMR